MNLTEIFNKAISDGKKVAFPKSCIRNNVPSMDFYFITDLYQLREGYKGITEPDIENFELEKYNGEKALCMVPGVVFSTNCNRIGYGKGFYDRFLFNRNNIITMGICYECQICNDFLADDNDVALDYIFTEESIYKNE